MVTWGTSNMLSWGGKLRQDRRWVVTAAVYYSPGQTHRPSDIFWNISFHPNQFWFDSEFWSEIRQIAILMLISNLYSKVFRIRGLFHKGVQLSTAQYPRKKSLPVFLRLLFIQERKFEFPSLPQGGTVRPCWEAQSILSASNRSII